jgi:hypothetical protein
MDFTELMWERMDWIRLIQDKDQWQVVWKPVTNLPVP